MEGYFRIVTPVYNAEKWIGPCIKSVLSQTDDRWTQIIVVDGATDNTYYEAVLAANNDSRIKIIKTDYRKGTYSSHKLAHDLHEKNEQDVFVHLDGDDRFLNNNVLSFLRNIYEKNKVWATYGNYITSSGNKSICRSVNLSEGIRSQILKNWPFSHLRTFKCFLWEKLKNDAFLDSSGKELTSAVDVAIFAPILEMCGNRIAFIKTPLYFYNDTTGINDHSIMLNEQVRSALEIYKKKEYKIIE
jgi:glycosyltransferase involved in cell wall biosynthesis